MKLKNIFLSVAFSAVVVLGFSGCGNEKSESAEKSAETGDEIKKISGEEVYELLAQVEKKQKRSKRPASAFQEKWDQLKRKQSAADRAFSKNDYDAAFKFLQEAEAAADWILNQGPSVPKWRGTPPGAKAERCRWAKA